MNYKLLCKNEPNQTQFLEMQDDLSIIISPPCIPAQAP